MLHAEEAARKKQRDHTLKRGKLVEVIVEIDSLSSNRTKGKIASLSCTKMDVSGMTCSHSTGDAPAFLWRGAAARPFTMRRTCTCLLLFCLGLLQFSYCGAKRLYNTTCSSSSSSLSSTPASIAMCYFRTGDAARDTKLTPFYVPASDKAMYEEGVRDYLQRMGASAEQLSVVCEEMKGSTNVKCELCLYNEISADQKHVRQGQVIDPMLMQCMGGTFDQASIMETSEYHPVCYPRPQQRAARSLIARGDERESCGEPTKTTDKEGQQLQRAQQQDEGTCNQAGKSDAAEEQKRIHS